MLSVLYKYFFYITIIVTIISCERELNIDFPQEKKQIVLNSILTCDSTIKVNLEWTGTPLNKNFIPITDASINIYINDELLLENISSDNYGNYTSQYIIKEGEEYRIEALSNQTLLKSSVSIPNCPLFNIKQNSINDYEKIFNINIDSINDNVSALYFYIFSEVSENGMTHQIHETALYCNSALSDPFNRSLDDWGPEGFHYEYDYFVRFDASNIRNRKSNFDLAIIHNEGKIIVTAITAGSEYDMYFKSYYTQQNYDIEVNLPFSYTPKTVPGNIDGGLGIFAGINISTFEFE
ncbi:DUF4249 family protein [Plebeiibacterium sediminum]|uniref:DUF4249 domain-containing protein n=1 Tax=Plebeiibacterium sediminum TaxID=2992112 RepID=A0AAE3SGZ0_9BACT|nr:DUF4249 family protein [Plebeiobacterium sediminum]MCW3788806.1 DUF4249 domain-containing protein [Plebeiobacterium sediminum]